MRESKVQIHLVVGCAGAVVMALEILSSRVLAPSFGNSVYTWGSIISVFLAALSLGYAWGGRLADRMPRLAVLGQLLLLAATCEVALAMWATEIATRFSLLTGGSPWGTLLAATVLFGPVSVLLAMTSPFAVRLAATALASLGETAGHLYAISTVGSLFGTLTCTFLLVPYLELQRSFRVLIAATAVAGLLAMAGATSRETRARWLGLILLIAAAVGVGGQQATLPGLLLTRVTPYQTLQVSDHADARLLTSDGVAQGAVRLEDGEPGLLYPRFAAAALLLQPSPPDRFLGLGLGTGSVGSYLARRLPGMQVEYVEVDPAVEELARRYLLLDPPVEIVVALGDARRFLAASDRRWPLIYADTYIGLSIPFHLTTVEFFDLVRQRLEPRGVFAMNVAGGTGEKLTHSLVATLHAVFGSVEVFRAAGNLALFASDRGVEPGGLARRAAELDARYRFEPSLGEIARQRVELAIPPETEILSDAYAPVDRLLFSGDLPRHLLEEGRQGTAQ